MRKSGLYGLSSVCVMVWLATSFGWGAEVSLTDRTSIVANSAYDATTLTYTLNPNANGYIFAGGVSMTSPAMNLTLNDAGTTLSVNPTLTTNNYLGMSTGAFTLGNGAVVANGPSTSSSPGLTANSFTTVAGTSGSLSAIANKGYGLEVKDTFTHAGSGAVTATGNVNGQAAASLLAGTFRTEGNHGTVTSIATSNMAGIFADSFDHSGSGLVDVVGGNDFDSNGVMVPGFSGMYVSGLLNVDGQLRMTQQGEGSAIHVYGFDVNQGFLATSVTFGADAVLIPVIDLQKPQAEHSMTAHLTVGNGNVVIGDGAVVKPEIKNLASLTSGEARNYEFIRTNASTGRIDGEFTLQADGSLIVDYQLVAEKNGDETVYYLRFGATTSPADIITNNGYCSDNTRALILAMGNGLNGQTGPGAGALNDIYDRFADFNEAVDIAKYSTALSLSLTPQQFSRLYAYGMRQADAVQRSAYGNLKAVRSMYLDHVLSSRDGLEPANWQLWADPLFQGSWDHRPITCGFGETNEKFGGINMGVSRLLGSLTMGLSFHYLHGKIDGNGYDTDSDTFGATFAGRHDFASAGTANYIPWLQGSVGYSYIDYDQDRRDFNGNWNNSSPHAHLFRAGIAAGVDFAIVDNLTLTPMAGVDYTFVNQGAYSESNRGDLGLRVRSKDRNSLRPYVGVEIEGRLTGNFSLLGRAQYRYEVGDKRANLRYNFINVPTVATRFDGENVKRSSGNLGVGLRYRFTENAHIGANYDLLLEDRNTSHQFGLSVGIRF